MEEYVIRMLYAGDTHVVHDVIGTIRLVFCALFGTHVTNVFRQREFFHFLNKILMLLCSKFGLSAKVSFEFA